MESSTKSKDAAVTMPPAQPAIELVPAPAGSVPVVANFVSLETSGNLAFINFGLLEPRDISRMNHADEAQRPRAVMGNLAVRVVLPLDVLAGMHQQTHVMLQSLQKQFGSMMTSLSKVMADAKKAQADATATE